MRIEPADDAMFGERDAWRYEPSYDFYDSDGLPVKNPEFFFAARDDDGTLIGFYFLEPRVPDAEASLDELGVDGPFEKTHFGTKMTTVHDPDGRVWGLLAPLSGEPRGTEVSHG